MIKKLLAPWYRKQEGELQDERIENIVRRRREVAEHAKEVACRVEGFVAQKQPVRQIVAAR